MFKAHFGDLMHNTSLNKSQNEDINSCVYAVIQLH